MAVQTLSFGQELPNSGNNFLRVRQKGDKIKFRIAQEPVYTGKHFTELADKETGEIKWEVTECPRISSNEECDKCNKYFEIASQIKKMKAADGVDDSNPEIKKMKNDARKYSVSIQFYFPVLNRDTGKFGILQTTNGVRNKFNMQFEAGVDVLSKEWILRNTGSSNPNEKYSLSLVDSADVDEMSEDEKNEWEKAKNFDLSSIFKKDEEEL